ncbi:hypothetical protein AB0J21_19730 [Streptomyces sp. NPDC049954]|uniref:hypothetical protein n=1 Tax=Streptomyces sp. NPDC049954 TaxID=3155779 RepID=UPI003435A2D3
MAPGTLLPVDGRLAAALLALLLTAAIVAALARLAPDDSWRRSRDILRSPAS